MQGRFKMEYRLFTIVRFNYNYRDYNTSSTLANGALVSRSGVRRPETIVDPGLVQANLVLVLVLRSKSVNLSRVLRLEW